MSLNLDIPDTPRLRDTLAAGCLLMLVAAAGGAGYWIGSGSGNAPVREVIAPAPEQRQADGSLELERAPAAEPAKPPPAPHKIPQGATRERAISVTVQPKRADCPPVTVDLSLIRQDGGRRVIASSPDGTVTGGIDIPIEATLMPPAPLKWQASAMYEPIRKLYGVNVSRDFGRLSVGASVLQRARGDGFTPWISVGLKF